jgi:hypothetical protein
MALPRALPTEYLFPTYSSNLGPFYANGAVYIVGMEQTGGVTYLQVWKSSDPDSTAFAMQDADQAELENSIINLTAVSAYLDENGVIHVATASIVTTTYGDVGYFRFDTSTDTWSDGHGAWGTVLAAFGGDGDPAYLATDIRVHTVGAEEWIEISYNGGQTKVHGTNYDRAMLATYDPGVGWTADQVWDNSGTTDQSHYYSIGLVAPGTEHVHGLVINGTTGASNTVGVSTADASGNAPQPWEDTVGSITASTFPRGTGVAYNDGGTWRCRFHRGGNISSAVGNSNFEFDSADPVTTLTENSVMDIAPELWTWLRAISLDGTDVYTFYPDDVDGALQYDKNDGTDEEILSLTLTASSDRLSTSRSSYTVGGRNVIGIIYNDGGTQEYNEFSLAAPPDDFPVVPHEALQLSAIPSGRSMRTGQSTLSG